MAAEPARLGSRRCVRPRGQRAATGHRRAVQVTQGNASTLFASAADVAAGGGTSCASKTDGSAWCWGSNDYGQVGDGTTRNRKSAVRVKTSQQGALSEVVEVAGGYYYGCARRSDASVWRWGGDRVFARPVLQGGSSFLGAVQLAAHISHTCARKALRRRQRQDLPLPASQMRLHFAA